MFQIEKNRRYIGSTKNRPIFRTHIDGIISSADSYSPSNRLEGSDQRSRREARKNESMFTLHG